MNKALLIKEKLENLRYRFSVTDEDLERYKVKGSSVNIEYVEGLNKAFNTAIDWAKGIIEEDSNVLNIISNENDWDYEGLK
jgi:hypothetical protein